ncbi:MAG: 4-hydroxyphenylpyruvate dioxygenase [Oligoflexia bacterium]|nr:4-hydroxyphenylpyruvate dioxygenase [Oligoflexia bacterium]
MAFMTKAWQGQEAFAVEGFDHLEFYVGNAKQAAHYYRAAFGFEPYAYCGPETGVRDYVSYVLRQNRVFVVLTTPLSSNHRISAWLASHGDSVHDIALAVKDPRAAFAECLRRGGQEAYAPRELRDENGTVTVAGIRTYGETIHTFIDRSGYRGLWAPGFVELRLPPVPRQETGLVAIDHVVGNVEVGAMDRWAGYYRSAFGFMTFVEFDENDISTRYSALKSKVVRSKNWRVKMPLNEPARGLRKSQIEEYLEFNEGPGVQHVALLSSDIVKTIGALRANGVEFLPVPDAYYEDLARRVGAIDEDLALLQRHGILVDRDEEGYLLQLFTKPVEDRPTFFFEIIQRKGALGFGQGNFQALFESIEREQARRGNL